MTLRSYLRFLRPNGTFLVVGIYTVLVWLWCEKLFHLEFAARAVASAGIALPLMLGLAFAGAAHEPLHRPFALLLPGICQRLRNITTGAILATAGATTLLLVVVAPSLPPPAIFGLAAACASFACIDRHRFLGGGGGIFGSMGGWIGVTWLFGARLPAALSAFPWLFFSGGLAAAAACVAYGFSRRLRRERAATPAIAPQTQMFAVLFQPKVLNRRIEEHTAAQVRMNKKSVPGRDWPVREVGSSTFAWMHVVWHAFAGRTPAGYWRTQLAMPTLALFYTLLLPLGAPLIQLIVRDPAMATDYSTVLAAIAAPELAPTKLCLFLAKAGGMIPPFTACFALLLILHPQLPYPISRVRMARTVFGLGLAQIALALVLPTTVVWLCSLLGQFFSGVEAPLAGARTLAETTCALLVFLPALACATTFARPAWRLVWTCAVGLALLATLLARHEWAPQLFTAPGVASLLLLSAATFSLLWWQLHRYYRQSDLTFSHNLFNARVA